MIRVPGPFLFCSVDCLYLYTIGVGVGVLDLYFESFVLVEEFCGLNYFDIQSDEIGTKRGNLVRFMVVSFPGFVVVLLVRSVVVKEGRVGGGSSNVYRRGEKRAFCSGCIECFCRFRVY